MLIFHLYELFEMGEKLVWVQTDRFPKSGLIAFNHRSLKHLSKSIKQYHSKLIDFDYTTIDWLPIKVRLI